MLEKINRNESVNASREHQASAISALKSENEYGGIQMKEEQMEQQNPYCIKSKKMSYDTNSIGFHWGEPDTKMTTAYKAIKEEGGWISSVLIEVETGDKPGVEIDEPGRSEWIDTVQSKMKDSGIPIPDNSKFKTRTLEVHPCTAIECDGWTGEVNVIFKYTAKC